MLLKNAIEPDDASVYLVFGVTGVGKTRLMQEFQKRLVKHFIDELKENPGSLIVGGIEVDSYDLSEIEPEKSSSQKRKPNNVAERDPKRDPVGI